VFVPGLAKGVESGPPPPPPPYASCSDLLSPVHKARSLAPDCTPPDLVVLPDRVVVLFEDPQLWMRVDAAAELVELIDAAAAQGYTVRARSAFRSYTHQASLFQYWVAVLGIAEAERTSARAGYSEHQLGTAVDVCGPTNGYQLDGFGATPEGWWVGENAWRYGFNISYPAGTEQITGYAYEPWHLRYIGRQTAAQVRASGLTLHQYLGLS